MLFTIRPTVSIAPKSGRAGSTRVDSRIVLRAKPPRHAVSRPQFAVHMCPRVSVGAFVATTCVVITMQVVAASGGFQIGCCLWKRSLQQGGEIDSAKDSDSSGRQ